MNYKDPLAEYPSAYCGKMFVPASQHAMKDERGKYCKPTCFLHRHELAKSKCRSVIALRDGIATVYRSAVTAANELGMETKMIRDACRTGKPYRGYEWQYEM